MTEETKSEKTMDEKVTSNAGKEKDKSLEEKEPNKTEGTEKKDDARDETKEDVKSEEITEKKKDKIVEEDKSSDAEKTDETVDFSDFLPDNMEQVLKLSLFQIQPWAYIYMGLNLHPKQKKVVRDIRQAKMAIDAASAIVEILLPHIPENEQKELKVLMTDMRMNFMSKSRE